MPDPSKAVFLSYASQDAGAAGRICEALRAAGVEVWFDQSGGLEHGDEWDAKIRRQIKDCVFFLPVISASTESRHEGYFRIEWELAAERAMGFAHNIPFVLPIVIDETPEASALVPERFRRVQWTRLPGGAVGPEVQLRFSKLWAERTSRSVSPGSAVGSSHPLPGVPTPAADEKSIAVLPFANMSADAENEYFSDGMTEEIINALVQVPDLRVAARTSVFAFKGKADDLRTIAAKLNVRTVLEGSVRKAGNKIRITAQLINAADGFHLWSERFDRGLDDVFAVQDEIARTIAEKLKAQLAGGSGQVLVKATTADVEAYQLYLQGRFFWNQRGAGLLKGLKFFEAAQARDPNFAPAYAGLADTYSLLSLYGHARPSEMMPKARAAVDRALALDPTMAEAHAGLGHMLLFYDYDLVGAEREFQRAIELKPGYGTSYIWYGAVLNARCQQEQAIAVGRKGLQHEPHSLPVGVTVGWTMIAAGRAAEALGCARHVTALDPGFFPGYWVEGQALICLGRMEEGIAALRRSVEASRGLPWMVATLACGLVCIGRGDEARSLLEALQRRAASEYVPAFALAMVQAYLGDELAATEALRRSVEERDAALVWLGLDVGANVPLFPMGIPARYLRREIREPFLKQLGLAGS